MKTMITISMAVLLASCATPETGVAERPDVEIRELDVTGELRGENMAIGVAFEAEVRKPGAEVRVAGGRLSLLDGSSAALPRGARLERRGGDYVVVFGGRGAAIGRGAVCGAGRGGG